MECLILLLNSNNSLLIDNVIHNLTTSLRQNYHKISILSFNTLELFHHHILAARVTLISFVMKLKQLPNSNQSKNKKQLKSRKESRKKNKQLTKVT